MILNNTLYLGMYLLVSLCITYVLCSIVRFYMENNEMLAVKILVIIIIKPITVLVPRITLHGLIHKSKSLEEIASGMSC